MFTEVISMDCIQNKDLSKAQKFEIIITKEELNENNEKQLENIDYLMDQLERKSIKARQSTKILFQTEDNNLEIFKNKQIRQYINMIFNRYPHFLYFISQEDNNSKELLMLLSEINIDKVDEDSEKEKYKLSVELEAHLKKKLLYSLLGYGQYVNDTDQNIKKVIFNIFN